jgi:hypothetical protein
MYTQSDFKSRVNGGIQGKVDMLISVQDTLNEAVRTVKNELKFRTHKRRAELVPNLFSEIYEYTCPSDLEGLSIIDIPAQATREDGEFNLVPPEQFRRDRKKGDISIDDYNGSRVLLIDSSVIDWTSKFISTTSINDWTAFGDGENLELNSYNYISPSASIEFDINSAGGTTAGIYADNFGTKDLSEYINSDGAVFVNVRLTSATNVTNLKLRLGTSSGAYHEFTATTQNDGTVFQNGWNTVRFSMLSPTTTGAPDTSDIQYVAIYMTKTAGKVSEQGYLINGMTAKRGKHHNIHYYTKYGWKDTSGAYKQNSTTSTDYILADEDEYDIFVAKARMLSAIELDFQEVNVARLGKQYSDAVERYKILNPSEEKTIISSYYRYA